MGLVYDNDTYNFIELYKKLFPELCRFAGSLYRGTEVEPQDVVQDIFENMWGKPAIRSGEIDHIKAYLYAGIKNSFKNYITHTQYVDRYRREKLLSDDYLESKMVENELYAQLYESIDLLPEQCAKVFEMTLNGLSVSEICEQSGRSKTSVYDLRQDAIEILKKKILIFFAF